MMHTVMSPEYEAVVVMSVYCEAAVSPGGSGVLIGLVLLVVADVVPPDEVLPVTVVPPLGVAV